MKTYIVLILVLLLGVGLFAEFSMGLNSLFVTNYSLGLPGTPTIAGVIGIDPRVSFGPVYAGISAPFMLFAAGAGEGSSFMPFPPGIVLHAYIGGKFDIGNFYVMGDVGGVLVILAGSIPNFIPIRLGGGFLLLCVEISRLAY